VHFCSHVNLSGIDGGLGLGIGFLRYVILGGETFCQMRLVRRAHQEANSDHGKPAPL